MHCDAGSGVQAELGRLAVEWRGVEPAGRSGPSASSCLGRTDDVGRRIILAEALSVSTSQYFEG
jgi:hypothetical protein